MRLILLALVALAVLVAPARAATPPGYTPGAWIGDPQYVDEARSMGFVTLIAGYSQPMLDAAIVNGYGPRSVLWIADYRNPGSTSVVQATSGLPITGGYMIADEPPTTDQAAVAAMYQQVRQYGNGLPAFSTHWATSRRMGYRNVRPFVTNPFGRSADVFGVDSYPIVEGGYTRTACTAYQGGADAAPGQFWATVQGEAWHFIPGGPDDYTTPTVAQMVRMRDCALDVGARLIAWFWVDGIVQQGATQMSRVARAVGS